MSLVASGWLLGLAYGARHAFEPDHLAAVSTFVSTEATARRALRTAAAWGLGHGVTLVVAGGALVALRAELPAWASDGLELLVAALLVALGARGLVRAVRTVRSGPPLPAHVHASAHGPSAHGHGAAPERARPWRLPFVVGLVHGLAGSSALAALVAANLPSASVAAGFLALYAFGALVGMSVLAGLLGLPLGRLARSGRLTPWLVGASALVSVGVGIAWAVPLVQGFPAAFAR